MMRIAFFLVFLGIYLALNFYLFSRGVQALSLNGIGKWVFALLFAFLCFSMPIGMAMENKLPIGLTSILQHTGSTWLFAMMYFTFAAFFFDLIRLGNHFFDFYPLWIKHDYSLAKRALFGISFLLISGIFAWGNYKFNHPAVQQISIKTNKNPNFGKLRIVMASDVHLGYTIDKKRLQSFVELINAQQADIVLFAGDFIDRSLRPVLAANMEMDLRNINAPLGVYAIMGNHEYYGNLRSDIDFYQRSNITLLRDSVAIPENRFYVVGRDDRTNTGRKTLDELTAELNRQMPIIVLDHQPFKLNEAEDAKVDLLLAGHVHNGQVWPITLVARSIYELAYGYKQKGNTHIYVSSGLGIWGAHLRIGTQSEIVCIELT